MTKNNVLISASDLEKMVYKQEELNVKFNGLNWRDQVTLGRAKFAILDEVSEFLREIESDWKWWKFNGNYHKQKALFELIDVVHFALLLTLLRNGVSKVTMATTNINIGPSMIGPSEDKEDQFAKSITCFLASVDYGDVEAMLVGVCNIIQTGGELLGMTNSVDMYQAYVIKNSRNHVRVDNGVMTGEYNKAEEEDLVL